MLPDSLALWGWVASAVVPAYLLGSLPFGVVLTRIAGLGDPRSIGSGNIGATNVLRTGRRDLAAATLVLDAGKGALAVLAADRLGPEPAAWAALAAVLGHMFPPWLAFRGGKGVATTLGALAALSWPVAACSVLLWLLFAGIFRRSSVAALAAVVLAPPLLLQGLLEGQRDNVLPIAWPGDPVQVPVLVAVSVLVALAHHRNVRQLLAGTEPTIGSR